jgi:HPt (histidine-containing phosphotransfer) domain-containing protein
MSAVKALARAAPAIDLSTLRLFVGADDEPAVIDFLGRFFRRLDADMARMRDTIAQQSWVDATQIAHQMRSCALAIGASGFALLCATFETVAQGFDVCFGALERSFNEVRSAVKVVLVGH